MEGFGPVVVVPGDPPCPASIGCVAVPWSANLRAYQ